MVGCSYSNPPKIPYADSRSDRRYNSFCAERRHRAPPAHAHDAPFTHGHARIPDIAPPKWFRARSNATSLVPRARQALFKTPEEHVRIMVCRRDGDRAIG